MKKLLIFFVLVFCICVQTRADHITGGEMSYTYSGFDGNFYNYSFTLKLYMRCNSGRQFNDPTIISVFNKTNGARVRDISVSLGRTETIRITDPDPCISNPPDVCYEIGYYSFSVSVPPSAQGYIVAGQVNYRISGIANLESGYSQIGATYTSEIPGTNGDINNPKNNSARFVGSDLVVVCAENSFNYSFAAEDADKDVLRYSFCEAYRNSAENSNSGSGGFGGGNSAAAPLTPPYQSVPYGNNFSGSVPLGNAVSIDPSTGLISGTAPGSGVYVVTVCVEEVRNGVVIAVQRKDLQIAITNCSLTAAVLKPEYQLCRDTKTIQLTNLSISTLINSYYWEISSATGTVIHSVKTPTVTYTFPDTGIYNIKLVINPGDRCTDSTTSIARVYPGFTPAFNFRGICFTKPTEFTDATTSVYGILNSWQWKFGDFASPSDIAATRNADYTYLDPGVHVAKLVASDTKGCIDSLLQDVEIFEKPPVELSFRDTLICPPDNLQLQATGRGIYTWTPATNIVGANTATPLVAPTKTTTYYVHLDDDGCINNDSVLIRVTNSVQLNAMNDTTICAGDSFALRAATNGLKLVWTPAAQLSNANDFSPLATTFTTTSYGVTAYISNCSAQDNLVVTTVPYPIVDAGPDQLICFNAVAKLAGNTNGSQFAWSPAETLSDAAVLSPNASPTETSLYILTATDIQGCPKPASDSVVITVLPDIMPEVTNDTAVVIGENLQLLATGGTGFDWTPSTGLSATNIPNPVATYSEPHNAIRYLVVISNDAGCSDTASMVIKVFGTRPAVFVPTGFTPNGDGKNDILRPIAVGMKKIDRFSIFNRYGQQVFSTTTNGVGWDGRINGLLQPVGTYVWYVEAVDFTGKKYSDKGTSTLVK